MGMDPVSWALLAGTALSAGAAIKQGADQKKALQWQSEQEQADAQVERDAAVVRADQIRKAAERQRSKAVGAQAASGVRIGEGSAADAEAYITRTGEYDALSEIMTGKNRGRRLDAESQMSRIAGDNAFESGLLNAGGTVLGNYGLSKGFALSKSATTPYRGRSSKNFGH